jgi:hypothetical protein
MASPMASWMASPMATLTLTLAPTMSLPIRPGAPPRAARPAVVQPNPLRAARRRLECGGDAPSPLPKRLSGEEQSGTEWSLPLPFPPTCPLAALAAPPPRLLTVVVPCNPPPPMPLPIPSTSSSERASVRERPPSSCRTIGSAAPRTNGIASGRRSCGIRTRPRTTKVCPLHRGHGRLCCVHAPVTPRSWPTVLRACARYTAVMADCAASK